jgi:CBS domain-containing protein
VLIFPTETVLAPAPTGAMALDQRRVGEVLQAAPVKVPSWFTAQSALRVGSLKRAEHLLVIDRGRPVGAVSTRVLGTVPAHEPVGRWMSASTLVVTPETTLEQARGLMHRHCLETLPVVSGALLLGMITVSDLG